MIRGVNYIAMELIEGVSAVQISTAYLGGGDREKAIEWLRTAVAERDGSAPFIGIDPVFAPVRNDPRFQQIARDVGAAITSR